MSAPPDFGWKEGFCQLGSFRDNGGLSWVYAPRGCRETAQAGTVWGWIMSAQPYTNVRMITSYEPSVVNAFPTRTAVRGGVLCSFPSIEADALVAGGVAAYA